MISAERVYAMLGNPSLWQTAKSCHELLADARIPYPLYPQGLCRRRRTDRTPRPGSRFRSALAQIGPRCLSAARRKRAERLMSASSESEVAWSLWIALICRCDICGVVDQSVSSDRGDLMETDPWAWSCAVAPAAELLGWTAPSHGELRCPKCGESTAVGRSKQSGRSAGGPG
jgi:hypothetical protein